MDNKTFAVRFQQAIREVTASGDEAKIANAERLIREFILGPAGRIRHWWKELHPDWQPSATAIREQRAAGIIPESSDNALPDITEVEDYLMVECGFSFDEQSQLDFSEIEQLLRRAVERKSREPECHVTLSQMAAIVNKSKRQLERERDKGKLPAPSVKGGRGKSDEWKWSEVRTILETMYGRELPEVFPADRFIRR